MSWVATAIVGGAAIGAVGSNLAAGTQASGQKQATATQQNMFNTVVGQEQPFLQGGYNAEAALNELLGIAPAQPTSGAGYPASAGGYPGAGGAAAGGPAMATGTQGMPTGTGINTSLAGGGRGQVGGANATFAPGAPGAPGATGAAPPGGVAGTGLPAGYLTQTFNPTQEQLNNYPGYQFALQTGGQAVRNADTPGVGALSGPALKDFINFDVGTANQFYGQYFNQFQTQQNNIFNRLSNIAGLGQNAAGNLGNVGAQLGTGIAQAQAGAAASQAGGIVGATNSIGSGITGLALSQFLNNSSNPPVTDATQGTGGFG